MAFRHSLNLPAARPSSSPSQFTFQPQRIPFNPPTLRQDESSGTAFLADLSDVPIPPVASATPSRFNYNAQNDQVQCNVCTADLTGLPRVHCLDCARYDVCSACHIFGDIGRGHRREHHQQTFKPVGYPRKHRRPYREDGVVYQCDVCNKELTNEPRARCAECKNYDLCLDCNLTGESTLRHKPTHNVNIITSHLNSDGSVVLMGPDYVPTSLLEKLLDSIFEYIDVTYTPRNTGLLEPPKISAFYSNIGVDDRENIGRREDSEIARKFSILGCEHYLVSDNTGEIQARSNPWIMDGLDTRPKSPALTRAGWIRYFVLMAWKNPDLMHFVVSGALSTGKVIHKRKSEPYRLSVPRDSFPRQPKPVARPSSGYDRHR